MNSREQFEAWATSNGISIVRTPQPLMFASGQRRAEGDYILIESLCAWEAWQASRAAVVVELPARANENLDTGGWPIDPGAARANSIIAGCRRAIEAAGVKVAP